jgi:3-isopropylmalate/(R)-2-methylmalate dehydratase small subunit
MTSFADIQSRAVKLLDADIDTDQMVPARYLRTSESSGLGRYLFYDRRFDATGALRPDFPLNPPGYGGESILLAGDNFGCGSSREHAPWALADFGIRVIIAPSFADIFYNNCLKNGLLAVVIDRASHRRLCLQEGVLTVSLQRQTVEGADLVVAFRMEPFARFCLLQGLSQLDYIVRQTTSIASFEAQHRERLAPTSGLMMDGESS